MRLNLCIIKNKYDYKKSKVISDFVDVYDINFIDKFKDHIKDFGNKFDN